MDAKQLVQSMTLEEKASLCSGENYWHLKAVERLGLDSIMVSDGPHGLRKQNVGEDDNLGIGGSIPATCFPTAATTANSFDEALLRELGEALAGECLQGGVSVLLGPGVNIKRSPLCGRNFEYISEDPYLTGRLATAIIDGVQSGGVGTSMKHFAANSQEKARLVSNSVVDERALREIYLAGFETAVKQAKPWTLMCSYNRVNGTYACENKWLLTEVLREEWGFEGIVMTDWGAMDQRVPSLKAGLELEMPGSGGYNDKRIVDAVNSGLLDEAVLDEAVERLVRMILRAGMNRREGYTCDMAAHHALARRAAAESAVLLKNDGGLLPVKQTASAAVIGAFAKTPRYQGAGSSKINPTEVDCAWQALADAGLEAEYAAGYSLEPGAGPDEQLVAEACRAAKGKDVVLLFAGLPDEYESEGYDRTNLDLPTAHNRLIEAVCKVNENVVVVLQNGAPVLLPWQDDVKAILAVYLGGQAGGSAVADLVLGAVCPSGKLAETWPLALEDNASHLYFPGSQKQVQYRESIFVGYRWYDTAKRQVAFPFGHGLSYTTFAYSGLSISRKTVPEEGGAVTVKCKVKNTGSVAGAEVVQLYVAKAESAIPRAAKELKAFAKVFLEPGEEKTVSLELDARAFSYYNTAEKGWRVEGGAYSLLVAASSRDVRLRGEINAKGDGCEEKLAALREAAPVYFSLPQKGPLEVGDAAFRAVYGRALPAEHEGKPYSWNTTLHDLRGTGLYKVVMPFVTKAGGRFYGSDKTRAEQLMVHNMFSDIPLRAIGLMSKGAFTLEQVEGVVDILNKRPVRGARVLFKRKPK